MSRFFSKFKIIYLVGFLALAACAKSFQPGSAELASTAKDTLGCENLRSRSFDVMYAFLETQQASPSPVEIKKLLYAEIMKLSASQKSDKNFEVLANEVVQLYSLLNEDVQKKLGAQSYKEHLRALIQLELGNTSTPQHVKLAEEMQRSVLKISALGKALALSCGTPAPAPTPPPVSPPPPVPPSPPVGPQAKSLAQFGAHFAFATAYQSCQVLDLPDMNANTEDVQGVEKGKDIGGGFQRYYASIPDIQRTHYYIRNINYGNNCIPVSKKPLVYDFGGEPSVELTRLNFFVNAGDGGSALGMDCSAFISSALATAGLKYTPQVENKPIFVRQLSYDFIDPQASGWKCFDRVKMEPQQGLMEGDILAVQGHVVMVDRVGADPFGLNKVSSSAACAQLTYRDFDFTVIQSSQSKGSIGINRYIAKDYLAESDKMRVAFEKYGRASCQAHFLGKTVAVSDSTLGLIRHKQTAECVSKPIALAGQSCIESCREFSGR